MADSFAGLVGSLLGGAAGAIGGPAGIAVGSAAGAGLAEWLFGDDDADASPPTAGLPSPPQTAGGDLAFGGGASGGGGAGVSFAPPGAGLPQPPTGGLDGPVYGTQNLPAAAQAALSGILAALKAYPYLSDLLQRRWNFPTESEITSPKSQALWAALARQVPASHREALEQFLVGFPAPVGLSKSASDVFLTLMIAEAGYTPEALGCCPTK